MKILTLWAEATVKPSLVLLALIAILMIGASGAQAYSTYSTDGETGNCLTCHGDFRDSPYTSLSPDGGSWADGLHDTHRNDMLGGDCSTCHASSGGFFPVTLDSSGGGDGLAPISCVGCHGRDQDGDNGDFSGGLGAGLRQHHTEAGISGCTNCHTDAVPANYTPVAEGVLPNYYAFPGTDHPNIPSNPCNPADAAFEENFAGTTLGLDNDGDGIYDMADIDCDGLPVELMIFEIE